MNKSTRILISAAFGAALLLVALVRITHADPANAVLTLEVSADTAQVGETVTVDVRLVEMDADEEFEGWQVLYTYNDTVLQVDPASCVVYDLFGGSFDNCYTDESGEIYAMSQSTGGTSGTNPPFLLMTVDFTVQGVGTSDFDVATGTQNDTLFIYKDSDEYWIPGEIIVGQQSTSAPPTSVELTPDPETVTAGGTVAYTLTAADDFGNSWDVTDQAGFAIEAGAGGSFAANLYTSQFAGQWTVTGSWEGLSDTAQLTVEPGALDRVDVSPAAVTLGLEETQQFTAVCYDAYDNPVTCTPTWNVADPDAGGIDQDGLFTAGTVAGSYANVVEATVNGVTGTAGVTVEPGAVAQVDVSPSAVTLGPQETQQFSSTCRDAHGNQFACTATWSMANLAAGSINAGTGLFTATSTPGTFPEAIRATVNGVTGTADVTVEPGALARVDVSPAAVTLALEGTQQFTAACYDAYDNPVTCIVTWSVADPTAGSIGSTTGLFTAGTVAGSYANVVEATVNGVTGTAGVTVEPGAVAQVDVSPSSVTLGPQGTQQFTAICYDAHDNQVTCTATWSMASPAAGSINAGTGLFTATSTPGTFPGAVMATVNDLTATADVTVQPGPVAQVEVSPPAVTLGLQGTQQFTATCYDAFDNQVTCTPTWTVLDAIAGSIGSATGQFTAGTVAGSYPNVVVATANGATGTADVTVEPGQMARVDVSPSTVTLGPQGTQQFTAICYDAYDNQVACTATWSVTDADAGSTEAATGLFTAGTLAGSYPEAVAATANGLTGTADVTVEPGEVAQVDVSPPAVTLGPEGTQQFTATCYDAYDNQFVCTPTWSVADADAGGIEAATGLFTAGTLAGTYQNAVVATVNGVTGTADVTVEPDFENPQSVTIEPDPETVTAGESVTYTLTAADAFGNTWDVTAEAAFTIQAGAGGSFEANVYTSQFAGQWMVTGSWDELEDTATLTVQPDEENPQSVTIEPDPETVTAGESVTYTLTAADASGNTWDVTGEAAFTIDAGAGGSFEANVYRSEFAGQWTVRGEYGGLDDRATLTVEPGDVARVEVSPEGVSLVPGETQQFTATCYDAYDNQVVCTPTWSVADPEAGSIDAATGLFTAGTTLGTYPEVVVATVGTLTGTAEVTVVEGLLVITEIFLPIVTSNYAP